MITTADALTKDKLQRIIREDAKKYNIPDTLLKVKIFEEPSNLATIAQVSFRTSDRLEKYQAEISITMDTLNDNTSDTIMQQVDDVLEELEHYWLTEGGSSVVFYNGHGFFHKFEQGGGRGALEVQCTVCNHLEIVNKSAEVLEEYRDVFLMKTLPEAHAKCDCDRASARTERFKFQES